MPLDGAWHNELGSTLTIALHDDGTLDGTYEAKVGDAVGCFTVSGRYDAHPTNGLGTALGWSVSWRSASADAHSLTSWAGLYFVDEPERISTTWLLVIEGAPDDVWESTLVGHDLFTRSAPPGSDVRQRLALGTKSSHPLRPR